MFPLRYTRYRSRFEHQTQLYRNVSATTRLPKGNSAVYATKIFHNRHRASEPRTSLPRGPNYSLAHLRLHDRQWTSSRHPRKLVPLPAKGPSRRPLQKSSPRENNLRVQILFRLRFFQHRIDSATPSRCHHDSTRLKYFWQ